MDEKILAKLIDRYLKSDVSLRQLEKEYKISKSTINYEFLNIPDPVLRKKVAEKAAENQRLGQIKGGKIAASIIWKDKNK